MDMFAHLNVYVPKGDKWKQLIKSTGISPPALITAVAFVGATAIAVATCYLKPKQDREISREIGMDVNDRNGIYPPSESQCSTATEEGGDQHEEVIEATGEKEIQNEVNGEVDEMTIIQREFMNETIIEENGATAEEEEKIEAIDETQNVSLEEEGAKMQELLADIETEYKDAEAEDVDETPKDKTS